MTTERLPTSLTDDERNARARNATSLHHELEMLRERKKEAAKEYGEQIAELETALAESAKAARTGMEERDVEVRWSANIDRCVMELFREDTGEKVRERPMTDEEQRAARQQAMPFHDPKVVLLDASRRTGAGAAPEAR